MYVEPLTQSLLLCFLKFCIQSYITPLQTHTLHVIFLLAIMGVPALSIKAETRTFVWCWSKVVEINSACQNPNACEHTQTCTITATHKKGSVCVHGVFECEEQRLTSGYQLIKTVLRNERGGEGKTKNGGRKSRKKRLKEAKWWEESRKRKSWSEEIQG